MSDWGDDIEVGDGEPPGYAVIRDAFSSTFIPQGGIALAGGNTRSKTQLRVAGGRFGENLKDNTPVVLAVAGEYMAEAFLENYKAYRFGDFRWQQTKALDAAMESLETTYTDHSVTVEIGNADTQRPARTDGQGWVERNPPMISQIATWLFHGMFVSYIVPTTCQFLHVYAGSRWNLLSGVKGVGPHPVFELTAEQQFDMDQKIAAAYLVPISKDVSQALGGE